MAVNNALNRSQADACTIKIVRTMQPLKCAEQFIGVSHIETSSVIPDEVFGLVPALALSKRYFGFLAFGRELPGVSQKVFQYDPNKPFIPNRGDIFFDV